MKNAISVGAALLLTTSLAQAAGIERGANNYGILFEEGNYVELGFSSVRPDIDGDYPDGPAPFFAGGSTGNMAEDYQTASLSLKYAINDQLDVGLFLNQPFGADAFYSQGLYTGLGATWEATGVSVVLKYQVNPNISVYGGARSVESQPEITIPGAQLQAGALGSLQAAGAAAVAAGDLATAGAIQAQAAAVQATPTAAFDYSAETEADRQTSYIAGVAYERPEIALRVALTYESGFTHSFATTENLAFAGIADLQSETEIEMPQSVTLDFQSGVAADTLVFGSIKWQEWSVWDVRPVGYATYTGQGNPEAGDSVTGFDNDTVTYRIGVGRRINEDLSVFGRITYEDGKGGVASRLAPVDGSTAIGIGGTYTRGQMKITGGVEYVMFGDATDGSGTEFADNTAIGFGLSVGYSF